MPGKGIHIRLEGGEGLGKTLQAHRLADFLRSLGIGVVHIREPGGTALAEALRSLVLGKDTRDTSALTNFLQFSTARSDVNDKVVRPALEQGHTVIGDRSWVSSLAYQGYGMGLDRDFITYVSRFLMGDLQPDVTLIFDAPIEVGLSRRLGRGTIDRFEEMDLQFHRRVNAGFLRIAEEYGYPIIDAEETIEQVETSVREIIRPLILERYPNAVTVFA